ncbi:MAG: family 10 glycosylhydrolase [Salegentibacter sp.]|uniref:Glycosyl hydrolase-like 10 n=1 Tax=Salegentibacter flavus TaxID=287099 RepID=A0A1I4ZEP7_9FLAO|nr:MULTISPECIES: family 10 glycosylhydrolase [Salegentibacter]MDR9456813.1 family 10 glycosylhydrolase [Salegentibacter sp.]SFN48350.1 Glycosyl hydrolase-like 10 [Salegentibacter flavus]
MKTKLLLIALLAFGFTSCLDNVSAAKKNKQNTTEEKQDDFKFWVWTTADAKRADSSYTSEFKKYSENGIEAVLINTNTDPELLSRLTPLAKKEGLEVHAWIMTMIRPGDSIALQHPDWYAVSREGNSTHDTRPYVDYYQWLCPTREESRNHVLGLVEGLAKVEGVASVHLDYIRFSDIFLPIGLLPKYDLEQEEELPEFDFCYCDVCIAEFEKIHHKNPRDFENPAIDMEWKQFRLNKIKAVVDEAYEIAHSNNKELTAAVFPYPEMADHMVRQRWDKWKIDAVLPMIYHNFYNEEVDWIGYATKQGVKDLKGRNTDLHTGIFLPPMSAEEVTRAIKLAKENGAKGISFFDGNALTEAQLKAIKEASK